MEIPCQLKYLSRKGIANLSEQKGPTNININSHKTLSRPTEYTAGYLHINVLSSEANLRFCRTSLSAALTGYPFLNVTNWENEYSGDTIDEISKEKGKLLGTLRYLEAMHQTRDNDLVLVVDAEDTWFQLRPDVLVHRYREIIRRADKRMESGIGKGVSEQDIQHGVVFAAQRVCDAGSKDHISCYAAPESTLKAGKSRPQSPQDSSKNVVVEDPRPRYLNSQMIFGTVRALRKLHQTAYERWEGKKTTWTTRASLFGELFGEQEYAREMLRAENASPFRRLASTSKSSFLKAHPEPASIMHSTNTTYELGITLDYSSLLALCPSSPSTAFWSHFSSPDTLHSAAQTLNIASRPPKTLARDILHSRPPFWSLAPMVPTLESDFSLPTTANHWADMPLYTDLLTGITPALILTNKDTNPPDLNEQWKQMWFQPHARTKLTVLAYEPTLPIAAERFSASSSLSNTISPRTETFPPAPPFLPGTEKSGSRMVEKTYWSPVYISPIDKRREGFGFLVKSGEWRKWNEECNAEVQEQVLGDGKGPWVDRKVFPPY